MNRFLKKFKTILIQQNEENFDHFKNQEEAVIERFLDNKLENDIIRSGFVHNFE